MGVMSGNRVTSSDRRRERQLTRAAIEDGIVVVIAGIAVINSKLHELRR